MYCSFAFLRLGLIDASDAVALAVEAVAMKCALSKNCAGPLQLAANMATNADWCRNMCTGGAWAEMATEQIKMLFKIWSEFGFPAGET